MHEMCYKCKKCNHFTNCYVSKYVKSDKANVVRINRHEWKYSSGESTNSIDTEQNDNESSYKQWKVAEKSEIPTPYCRNMQHADPP